MSFVGFVVLPGLGAPYFFGGDSLIAGAVAGPVAGAASGTGKLARSSIARCTHGLP